ncbi:cysteine hydrolase family protein [Jiella mangrovi]|uniref:Cysteine hydrolase n=1 Tax=Jiella mangrovi TaxID=2821407 RepID=A0ABS4BME2_9HYPH|nr:cysteine hydrolase family protein [Jiella mangrovi]MBP0617821.1 cysteine hydrolase [Jiella mangrovi]
MALQSATLLVIDVQNGFTDPAWGQRNNPQAEANIARLLAFWRREGRPIRHVLHASRLPEGHFRMGTSGHQPKPESLPLAAEPVYRKDVNSAFIGTSLEQDLRTGGAEKLVVVGMTTNHCVSTTVRMAGNLGFTTFVVEDATATFDRMGLDGTMRPAAEVHAAALSDLSEEFATVVNTHEILTSKAL